MPGIAAAELTHILWSSLPRPSPLAHLRRTKGEQAFPGFLLDLISKSAQSKQPQKQASIAGPQPQAHVRASAKGTSKIKPARVVVHDLRDSRLAGDSREFCEKDRFPEALQIVDLSNQKDSCLEDSFYTLLQDCINRKDLPAGREVHSRVIQKGFHQNAFVACHLIRMFAVCGSLLEANHVFNSFLAPDSFTWSAIISAHAYLGQGEQAIKFYEQMLKANVQPSAHTYIAVLKACSSIISLHQGKIIHGDIIMDGCRLDAHISTMLIIMYATCGSIDDARHVFDALPKQDDVMYNVMMAVCTEYGDDDQALVIFNRMQGQCTDSANVIALVLGVKACSNLADNESGKLLHCLITEQGFELNTYACSALMAMYMECGNLEEACNLFARLPKKSEVTWSSMIAAFANLNDYDSALKYFKEMQQEGVRPNAVTYISILSACSHAGMLYEGLSHFNSMKDEHGIALMPDHYNCIVDLLARLGHVVEAEDLLHAMPFKPDAIGCMAMLSHCRTHGNVAGGVTSFHYSNKLDLRDASAYLLMLEIYNDARLQEDADKVKAQRKKARAYKKPGEASIRVNKEVHTFVVGERIHPTCIDIDAKLAHIGMQLKSKGYFPCLELIHFEHQIVQRPVKYFDIDKSIAV